MEIIVEAGTVIIVLFVLWIAWWILGSLFEAICNKIGQPILGAIAGGIFGFFWALGRFFLMGSPKFLNCIVVWAIIGAVFMFFLHNWDYKEPVIKRRTPKYRPTTRKARPD